MLITSLKPDISRPRATALFLGSLRELRYGRLRMVLDFYVPYHFYQLTWDNGRHTTETFVAVDVVTGRLDPYQFETLPANLPRISVETSAFVPARVRAEDAAEHLREVMMRSVFMKGFFKLSSPNLNRRLVANSHIPYWVGVYERRGRAHLEVIGALRGRFEGAKLREIVAEWFQPG
jgi:hypothetical protein